MYKEDNKKCKSKKKKIIIGIIVALIIGVVLYGIYIASMFIIGVDGIIDAVGDKIDEHIETNQERENIYNSIVNELELKKIISNDLTFVSEAYGWSGEWIDRTDKYYFYIDKDKYEEYKNYWLEDVSETRYRDGYNGDLGIYGDKVFYAINIRDTSYISDIEYRNVHLTANKTYYLVKIYNSSVYYKSITKYETVDTYSISSHFNVDYDSLSNKYIFYQENGQWVMEELIRE